MAKNRKRTFPKPRVWDWHMPTVSDRKDTFVTGEDLTLDGLAPTVRTPLSASDSTMLYDLARSMRAERHREYRQLSIDGFGLGNYLSELAEERSDDYLASIMAQAPTGDSRPQEVRGPDSVNGMEVRWTHSDRMGTGTEVDSTVRSTLPLADGLGVWVRTFNPRKRSSKPGGMRARIKAETEVHKVKAQGPSAAEQADAMAKYGNVHIGAND